MSSDSDSDSESGLDEYADALADSGLEPGDGEVETAELVVTDDVLVKAFALGPGAELEAHDHPDSTNVFHVLEGTVTVVRGEDEQAIEAPGVVRHDRGVAHGARNETEETVIFTASLCPLPS
ncbi:Cupin domain-containing protein [Halobiforma haloterrestris]|uniref:Cupin domain-containing protein n=1 Tax=Natronobacterium haloterrestre TaxID=148448 RepID=A0A1I1FH52_NATHA|nr:cupin domain-containing protein [Halobiforma haloterrestris]SFB98695.1 Cupin domain-containing protein [Halobiforma haloterrestris]